MYLWLYVFQVRISPPEFFSLFFCFNFAFSPDPLLLYQLLLCFLLFYSSLTFLFFLCPHAHISSLFPTFCITVAPCALLPLSHVCHSISSVTIQELCPDFSEALGSKIQYLPGQTQNQYPPNTNTAHRQFSRSANDAGSYPATEFSDYRAKTTKKKESFLYQIHQKHSPMLYFMTVNTSLSQREYTTNSILLH